MSRENIEAKLRLGLEGLSAVAVADHFLSPHIHPELLRQATRDEGAPMWIVNRSDVYTPTLEMLQTHPLEPVRTRAQQKLLQRRGFTVPLEPPVLDRPLEEISASEVEDILGHPLCAFEAMIFFSRDLSEDHRGSAALSLTRRLLEYPPDFAIAPAVETLLISTFGERLLADPSDYVRAYCARIPLFPSTLIDEALQKENHPFVLARLVQNLNVSASSLDHAITALRSLEVDDTVHCLARVIALDNRLSATQREMLSQMSHDPCTQYIHEWYRHSL